MKLPHVDVTSIHPTPEKKMETLIERFDANLDNIMLALMAISAICLLACCIHKHKQDKQELAPQIQEIQKNLLSKRGDPGWPPAKEKNRMA